MIEINRTQVIIIAIVVIVIIICLILIAYRKPKEKDCQWLEKPKLNMKFLGGGDFTLYWNDVMKAESYNLFIATDMNKFKDGKIVENVTSPYHFTPDDPNVTYYFLLDVRSRGCIQLSNLQSGKVMVSNAKPKEEKKKVENEVKSGNNSGILPPPVLRCHDFFEFPNEGGYRVNTCSTGQSNSPSTRIFVQWFPVDGAKQYNVYSNTGIDVSKDKYNKSWVVDGSSYYFESDPFEDGDCWSIVVTAENENGESEESSTYTTCQT